MDETNALVVQSSELHLGTLTASTPTTLVEGASAMATTLAEVINRQKLYTRIQGRDHVRVEGWTTLAMMLGCIAREVSNEAQPDGSFVAVVELVRMSDGAVVSRASSECGDETDGIWYKRPRYAKRSMAATRATGKACRLAFSWIMTLAGYDVTPAEEMPHEPEPATRRESPRRESPKAERPASGPRRISDAQANRLRAIAFTEGERAGLTREQSIAEVKSILSTYGCESTSTVTTEHYDEIVEKVQATLRAMGGGDPAAEAFA